MVSKTICAIVALSMMAVPAQATMQLEHFLEFKEAPSVDALKLMVFWQIYAFLAPLLAGPLNVMLTMLWNGTAPAMDVNGTDVALNYRTVLSIAGIGNYDTLWQLFLGILPTAMIKYFISFSLLSEEQDVSYTSSAMSLIEAISMKELLKCTECADA